MADKELHPVVELLMARMKSHPEEFGTKGSRWDKAIDMVRGAGTDEEVSAVNAGLREVILEEVHVWVLDELCNGEERRAKQRMAAEEELKQKKAAMLKQYVQQKQQSGNLQQAQQLGSLQQAQQLLGVVNTPHVTSISPTNVGSTTDASSLARIMRSVMRGSENK